MGAFTPKFLFDLESNMRVISEREYSRIASRLWWQQVAKVLTSSSKKEVIEWLLSTAKIEDTGLLGGQVDYDDMVFHETDFTPRFAGSGLKAHKSQFEDLDGNGVKIAAEWSAQIAAKMAYWPQEKVVALLKNGHLSTSLAYDGVAYFSASHLTDPTDSSSATYANLLTGAASGAYPGACPIDESVTTDVALKNLAKIVAYIKSFKMPDGQTPRFLTPKKLIVPPALASRAVQLTNAKTIAQAAASGGGGADVEAVIRSFGWDPPIVADELAGFESSTTFFVGCEELASTELGGLVYVERDPFAIQYYTGDGGANADLGRTKQLEWECSGRNVAGYGHPYAMLKCKGS